MRTWLIISLSLAILFFTASSYAEESQGWDKFELKYFIDKSGFEDLTCHQIKGKDVNGFVELPNTKNAAGFAAGWSSGVFSVDTDGDGKMDESARKPFLFAELELSYSDGATKPYAAYFFRHNTKLEEKSDTQLWRWRRACSWKGKVAGEQIEVFDNNGNGKYDDIFEDEIRVGKSVVTTPYTGYIVLKDTLYECKIAAHGEEFSIKKYTGKTGTVNVIDGFAKAPKKALAPLSFTVISEINGKKVVVDVAQSKKSPVPVGSFKIATGILTSRIFVSNGEREAFDVKDGEETVLEWGGSYQLSAKAYCEDSGYRLEWDRSGAREVYKQMVSAFPTLKISFPTIKGEHGEIYVGNPLFSDLNGNCFADETVQSFKVEILNYKKKQVNKGDHTWSRYSNIGFGYDQGYSFEIYQCPFESFRGLANVTLSVTSKVFSPTSYQQEVEVEYQKDLR